MDLTTQQLDALEADRLHLIVVPLDPQPLVVSSGEIFVKNGSYVDTKGCWRPLPHTIGDRIPTPHCDRIVTDVQVKQVQEVAEREALEFVDAELDVECCNEFFVNQIGPDEFEQVCCGCPIFTQDPRIVFREHLNIQYPDAFDRNIWCAFCTVEKDKSDAVC